MRLTAIYILPVLLAGVIGLGTLSGTPGAAPTPKPTILCPPAC
jgi:hypothetical protein